MTKKDFWHNATVAVIGGGAWGTVLANLAANNCADVRCLLREEEQARVMNATRSNPKYVSSMELNTKIKAYTDAERVFQGDVHAVIWALPSKVCREMARELAPRFLGHEVILHATKGVEEGTLKRISVVLHEEIPCTRIGVISGPNLADEFARGEIGATVVASAFDEVIEAGQKLLSTEQFRVFGSHDIVGVEWAGTLKNILAIASGCLDGMKMGWNARAMLITRGLAEMVRFGEAMGAHPQTFMGLSGVGDLLATCSSPLSRNYRIGFALAQGKTLDQAVEELGATTEGIKTALTVSEYAHGRQIMMPITDAVCALIRGDKTFTQALHELMTIPLGME